MIVTPLVKKGIATAPVSRGDIVNLCYPPIQSSGDVAVIDATKIADGDVILIKSAAAPHPMQLPTAENLLKALKGNLEKTGPEPSANYLVAQNPRFDLVNETDKTQSGVSFTRIFFGDDTLPEGEHIALTVNTGIFFVDEGLDALASSSIINFVSREWKRLRFDIVNSSLPIAMKGSTPAFTHQNGILVDRSLIPYVTVGMSLYTVDGTIFDSVDGEVKVIGVNHDNGIIFLSTDNVADSDGFVFTLTPTINITPLEGSAPGVASVNWGDIAGDITDQLDLIALLEEYIPQAIVDAKGDLIVATAADTVDNLTVGANGSYLRAASGQATGLEWQLNKLDATTAPVVGDDSADGYSVGSRWIDVTNDKEYVCLDASVGAAVWMQTTGGGVSFTVIDSGNLPAANVKDILNIPATYSKLLLYVASYSFDTASRFLEAVVSTNNGLAWSTNGFYGTVFNGITPLQVANSASMISHTAQAAATAGLIQIEIKNYNAANAFLQVTGSGYHTDATITWSNSLIYVGAFGPFNAIRLRLNNTGNFDAGTYALIGQS